MKKYAKSCKTGRKAGAKAGAKSGIKSGQCGSTRTGKPQLQPVARLAKSPESLWPAVTSDATQSFAPPDVTAWLNSWRPTNAARQAVIIRRPPPLEPQTRRALPRPTFAVRAATPYNTDDRGTLFLMMAPFFVIALSLGISQTVKPFITSLPSASIAARPTAVPPILLAKPVIAAPIAAIDPAAVAAQRFAAQRLAAWTPPALPWPQDHSPPRIDVQPLPVSTAPLRPTLPMIIAPPAPMMTLPMTPPQIAGPVTPDAPPDAPPNAPQVCERSPPQVSPAMGRSSVPPQAVGASLAGAAIAQTRDFVVYSAKYQRLSYPLGDLASFYGACSDVVIRAYRTIGLDLQELVHRTRTGRGDSNIDHRRTETLRTFFTQYGESLPPTAFPENYRAGDIVTYYRPFSRVSRAHIAIVSDIRAPTGRLMIVHNRGWGPQLEDALFVDKITGHYRFDGTKLPPTITTATTSAGPPVALAPVAARRQPFKPGHLSRGPMLTPSSAVMEPVRAYP